MTTTFSLVIVFRLKCLRLSETAGIERKTEMYEKRSALVDPCESCIVTSLIDLRRRQCCVWVCQESDAECERVLL